MRDLSPSDETNLEPKATAGKLSVRRLTQEEFHGLAHVPKEGEWFANLRNPNTRRAYKNDVTDFMTFVGIETPEEFRMVTRAHVIAWRNDLEKRVKRVSSKEGIVEEIKTSAATVRRKLSALSSLFEYLCNANAVTHNPVKGVARPTEGSNEGKTAALGDEQVRKLLNAPNEDTLKGVRDRAILSTLFFHGLRCSELTNLKVKDLHTRQGIPHFRIKGKRDKIRYLPVNPKTLSDIHLYIEKSGHGDDKHGPLLRPITNNTTKELRKPLDPSAVYRLMVKYAQQTKLFNLIEGRWVHIARATAATNALNNNADISKVQQWLGHANISTTRLYDRRDMRPEDSPTFKVVH